MSTPTLDGRKITENANALLADRGISSKEKLYAGLETLEALVGKIAKMTVAITAYKELYKKLSAACSDYAEDRPTMWDPGCALTADRNGVESAIVTNPATGVSWRYTKSEKGYRRISGANMTAVFLQKLQADLPTAVKTKLELNITELNRLDLDASKLAEHDLARNLERKWAKVN